VLQRRYRLLIRMRGSDPLAASSSKRISPLILLSPAIARAYDMPPNKILTTAASALKRLGTKRMIYFLRKLYLTRMIKNPHVIHGTPFIQATYSNIVSVDLSDELAQLIDADHRSPAFLGARTPPCHRRSCSRGCRQRDLYHS
jgi:hypothetical protein